MKRAKTKVSTPVFHWNPRDWEKKAELNNSVTLMVSKTNSKELVVQKVMQISSNSGSDRRPHEVRVLATLPECNRIANYIFFAPAYPDGDHGMAIFPHFPLGDLSDWKRNFELLEFDKHVPEAYIWRMFVHIGQALAFIQNTIGPRQDKRWQIIHRDIKPRNILVVDNGSTYPSFKLIDFGVAMRYSLKKAKQETRCGTFDWQPPENPLINRKAADMWALGACVHYMAIGKAPIQDVGRYIDEYYADENDDPASANKYSSLRRYFNATVPREVTSINVSYSRQKAQGTVAVKDGKPQYNYQYSRELDGWMKKCLRKTPAGRPTVERLLGEMVPVANAMLLRSGGQSALIDLSVEFGS
ncbi:kinase-like protein [Massarina eburnea CBS 473.64]|uniref:Kinase-like protein n=1 Tax=Massarina eburnea CBS 473.64 TaxID=1395130 RepID=A0A6A6S5N1_9PLEO|nr:kinase-like protein [Massarina eburnea CBS 473.64]